MAGPNTTGYANPDDYRLGRGRLFVSVLNATTGRPTSWRMMGNSPEVTVTMESETLEHFSSMAGKKTRDKSVSISDKMTLGFKLEEFNFENLAAAFAGTQTSNVNPSVAGFASWLMVPDGELALGRWYDVKNSSHVRAYDIGTLTITTNEGSPVAMVLGTDYTVEADTGRIFILSTSSVAATAITGGKGLLVTLAASAGATTPIKRVKALQQTAQNVAVMFISENAANADHREEWLFYKGTLKADGDLSLIGDDWGAIGFTFDAEQQTLLSGNPTCEITDVPNT